MHDEEGKNDGTSCFHMVYYGLLIFLILFLNAFQKKMVQNVILGMNYFRRVCSQISVQDENLTAPIDIDSCIDTFTVPIIKYCKMLIHGISTCICFHL